MLIWAFIPYRVENECLCGYDYDTAQTKTELARAFHGLGLPWIWQPVTAENLNACVAQALEPGDSIVFNFCDGLDGNDTPGISVVRALEKSGLPFTGADSAFYCLSTSKLSMKRAFLAAGIATPAFEEIPANGNPLGMCERLGAPLLVKPDVSAASRGIGLRSKIASDAEMVARREETALAGYGAAFAERFIEGPEFTALVIGDWRRQSELICLPPAERTFNRSIPAGERFLSFDRYWGHHIDEQAPPDGLDFYGHAPAPPGIAERAREISRAAFCALRGVGYARVDLRMDAESGELYVLEVNANCGISEDDQTSTGCIIGLAGMPMAELLRLILNHAQARSRY